jgi:hypothetical protein
MKLMGDALIAFFATVGVTACFWAVAGTVLGLEKCTGRNVRLVLAVSDDAPAMEHDLRDLVRIRHRLPHAVLVLEDRGLTGEARELAEYLCRRYDGVELQAVADAPIHE